MSARTAGKTEHKAPKTADYGAGITLVKAVWAVRFGCGLRVLVGG